MHGTAIRDAAVALMVAGVILAFAVLSPAKAQTPPDVDANVIPIPLLCMDRADAMASINRHEEINTARGMTGPILVQVWSAPGGKFTITLRHPDRPDKLCGILAGEYWHEVGD